MFPKNWRSNTDSDKHSCTETITDLHIKLPGNCHQDLLEVKLDGHTESCILPLMEYRRMFPNNLTTDGLLKPIIIQSVNHIILVSYTNGILPVHGTVILKITHHKTGKFMLIRLFVMDIKNEIVISHGASTQLRLLKMLGHNRAIQCTHLDAIQNPPFNLKAHLQQQQFTLYKTITHLITLFKTIPLWFPQ